MTEATTTEEIREGYTQWSITDEGAKAAGEEFDAWLVEHDRAVAERAWAEGAAWGAVEFQTPHGSIESERHVWLVPEDNPYRQARENAGPEEGK